jgi:hypothetical protein
MKNKPGTDIRAVFICIIIMFLCLVNAEQGFSLPAARLAAATYNNGPGHESLKLVLTAQHPEFSYFTLTHPARFVLDIKKCYFPRVHDELDTGSASIRKIRISQFRPDIVRVVIDKKQSSDIIVSKKESSGSSLVCLSVSPAESFHERAKIIKPVISFASVSDKADETANLSRDSESEPSDQKKTIPDTRDDLDSVFNVGENETSSLPDIIPEESGTDRNLPEDATASKLSIGGDIRNKTAFRTRKPRGFSMINNTLNLKASGTLSDSLSYVLASRFSHDAVFDLTDNYNDNVASDQRLCADLRDAYIDIGLGNLDFRLGNQQIVWGQAVGLFFADIVNPKDLREFVLPDLDQTRIPVFAANMEYYIKNTYIQMIFIPFPEFNKFGKPGSEFDFSRSLYTQNADIILNDPEEPANSPDNSEAGLRVSKLVNGWDTSVFYLYDMYNFPVNYRTVSLNPAGSAHPVTIAYHPRYERMHRFGATFSKSVYDAVFKGEFIYNDKMFFMSSDITDLDGIEKSPSLDWLLGLDYTFFTSLETNFQLMQTIIFDHKPEIIQKPYTTSFSIWLKTGFFDNFIEPEFFLVAGFNQADYMIRPKITCNYSDSLKFILGADLFYGEVDGSFGLFDTSDRIYIQILYGF